MMVKIFKLEQAQLVIPNPAPLAAIEERDERRTPQNSL
jgi:hypothetical protein